MKVERHTSHCDRYIFDFDLCSTKKNYAQVDTAQDASYYGTWANPFEYKIVSYCEGDITIQTADNAQEFANAMLELREWTINMQYDFLGIDPGFSPELKQQFINIGLGDMVH